MKKNYVKNYVSHEQLYFIVKPELLETYFQASLNVYHSTKDVVVIDVYLLGCRQGVLYHPWVSDIQPGFRGFLCTCLCNYGGGGD